MAEAAPRCPECGAQQILRGTDWEIAVAAEMWQKQHLRTWHGDQAWAGHEHYAGQPDTANDTSPPGGRA
jgi:hypothetical protein